MANNKPEPMTSAFARNIRHSQTISALLAGAFFLASTYIAVAHFNTQAVDAQARACTAGLVPGPDGDLSESIDRLLLSTSNVAAVATLNISGALRTIYPDLPAYREAAAATLGHDGGPQATTVEEDGKRTRLWGVIIILGGDPTTTARRALILLRNDPYAGLSATLGLLFFLAVAVLLMMSGQATTQWFDRRVGVPLKRLHTAVRKNSQQSRPLPLGDSNTAKDVLTLERAFEELTGYVAASEAHNQGVRRDAERKVRDRETKFRHRLRRADDRATIDRLTRLRNRTFLEEELEAELSSHRRADGNFAVVMLDVDNFKLHNDTHGHQAGDDLLRFIGELLRGSIRPEDHAIRVGGDEFLLALPGGTEGDAQRVAERIVKMFCQWARALEGNTRPSLSAGIATSKSNITLDLHDLIAQADRALYTAKRAGKNTVNAH